MESNRFGRSAGRILGTSRRAALRRLGAAGLAGFLAAGNQRSAGAQTAVTDAPIEAAARRAISAINRALSTGDMNILDTAFAPDYVNHTPRRSLTTGETVSPDLAGLKSSLTALRAAVPDAVFLVDDVVVSGDTAAVRVSFRGTIDPVVVDSPALRGQVLRVGGAAFGRFVNGQVIESWDYDEAAELFAAIFQQPTPTPTPEPTPEVPGGETRDVRDFQEVALQGIGTLVIQQGDTESLTIDAEPKVLKRIETVVENGVLHIRPARSLRARDPITYNLQVRQLSAIAVSGAGNAQARRLQADAMRLQVDGASAIVIEELTANTLDASGSGQAGFRLGGTVDQQTVALNGASQYDAAGLASRVATVTAQGASQATVRVSESLNAQASGASSITYIGDPEVQESTSGASSITKAG